MGNSGKVVSGTIWTTIASLVQAIVQILKLSILTRFLDKSDFGLIAIVVLILGFTNIFSDLGISVSIYSKQNITKKQYSSLYWVSILLACLLYLIVVGLSPIIANFYTLPLLKELIPVMAIDLLLIAAGKQFRDFNYKALQFKKVALIDLSATLVSFFLAFYLAQNGYGVWSLVYSTLGASLISTVLLIAFGLTSHPIAFYINFKKSKKFYKIGGYQTGAQILDYIASQIDIIIIGKIMTPSELGVYNLIKQLVMRVYTLINPIISKISIPLLANINKQTDLLRANYLRMLNIVALVYFAIFTLLALSATEVLEILYGKSYISYFVILQILCIWGCLRTFLGSASTIIIVSGRTDIGLKWTIFRAIFDPAFIIIGSNWGLEGIVIGMTSWMFIALLMYFLIIKRIISGIDFRTYIAPFLKALFIAIIIFSSLSFIKINYLQQVDYLLVRVVLVSLLFMVLYYISHRSLITNLYKTIANK